MILQRPITLSKDGIEVLVPFLGPTTLRFGNSGMVHPQGRRNYRDTALRIKSIVEDYEGREITDYLRGIACNFQFQAMWNLTLIDFLLFYNTVGVNAIGVNDRRRIYPLA